MRIASYISELLYRYDCVIVPGFGGFVTNETAAKLNLQTHTFYPPTKQITFNSYLKNNDGLLANYIASVENISFSKAVEVIKNEIEQWNLQLQNDVVEISKIGSLSLNEEGNILFDPVSSENYLTTAFGLASLTAPQVNRKETTPVITLDPKVSADVSRRKTPAFLKYAASAAILFAVGSFTWNNYNQNQYQEQIIAEQHQQKEVEQKIQAATFVIENPLPTITLNVHKEVFNYHIIAGAFRESKNADKKVKQLVDKGFDAQILGVNKWGLTQVSYASFNSKTDALKNLKTIKKTITSDAWLLVQEF